MTGFTTIYVKVKYPICSLFVKAARFDVNKTQQIEGLAKHLRCVGLDAATPSCKKPQPRSSPILSAAIFATLLM